MGASSFDAGNRAYRIHGRRSGAQSEAAPRGALRDAPHALEQSDYYADTKQNFVFYRNVMLDDEGNPDLVVVEVDLIAGEYGLAGKRRQSQRVQDPRARKARGADLVFKEGLVERVPIEGRSPSGAMIRANVRVAGPVPFLVMKANALARRDKPKDAYDIWFL